MRITSLRRAFRASTLAISWAFLGSGPLSVSAAEPAPPTTAKAAAMIDVLKRAFSEEKDFVRIHAAEALVEAGEAEFVIAALAPEADTAPPIVRVGIWRTLGMAQPARLATWV